MKRYISLLAFILLGLNVSAKEYVASFFGIKSDGITNNTGSIQKAIDYISENRGGTLVFYVGRYLTGTIHLKSNVSIRLEEGAVLVGATSPFDYNGSGNTKAIIEADGQSSVGISGKGVVEGGGITLVNNAKNLIEKGYLKNNFEPALISFKNCTNVSISGLHFWYGPYNAIAFEECKNVNIDGTEINGKGIGSSAGITLTGCKWVNLKDMFVEVAGAPLVSTNNQFVLVKNSITNTGKSIQ